MIGISILGGELQAGINIRWFACSTVVLIWPAVAHSNSGELFSAAVAVLVALHTASAAAAAAWGEGGDWGMTGSSMSPGLGAPPYS